LGGKEIRIWEAFPTIIWRGLKRRIEEAIRLRKNLGGSFGPFIGKAITTTIIPEH